MKITFHSTTTICDSSDPAFNWLLHWPARRLFIGSVNGQKVGKSSPIGWSDQVLSTPNHSTFNSC